jgi:hypothetical protein
MAVDSDIFPMFVCHICFQNTFIGARNPFKAPSSSLVVIAIQYLTLNPNKVLKTMVERIENSITGFRPMRSATIPQKMDAKPLPTI